MGGARNKPRPGQGQTRMADRTNKERSQNKPKGNPEQTRMAHITKTSLFGPDFWFVRSTDPYCSKTDPYCSIEDQTCSIKDQICSIKDQICSINDQICSIEDQICSVGDSRLFSVRTGFVPCSSSVCYLFRFSLFFVPFQFVLCSATRMCELGTSKGGERIRSGWGVRPHPDRRGLNLLFLKYGMWARYALHKNKK